MTLFKVPNSLSTPHRLRFLLLFLFNIPPMTSPQRLPRIYFHNCSATVFINQLRSFLHLSSTPQNNPPGYGIATPKGSPWRDKISLAILELQEKGEIAMLYDKWWSGKAGGKVGLKHESCAPRDKTKTSKANALNVDNIGGVFVVLLCGIAFSVLVAIIEFYYNSKRVEDAESAAFDPFFYFNKSPSSPGRQSLCAEMTQELCYALQCYGPRQRPTLKRQCLKCTQTAALLSGGESQTVIGSEFGTSGTTGGNRPEGVSLN